MDRISFSFADNLNSPIMLTNIEGKVIYKNHCAKKCVKSPRIAANINKHINKKIPIIQSSSGKIRITSIINHEAVHKRAFVCRITNNNEPLDIWFFGSSLQIPDIDHLESFDLTKLESCLENIIEVLKTLDFQANKSSIDRYIQIGTPFLEALRNLRYSEDPMKKFRVYRILESIKRKTYELASIYSVHIDLDTDMIDPGNYYHLCFQSFSSLYVQALLTMLKISHFAPVRICCSQQAEFFNMKISAPVKLLKNIPKNGSFLFEIAASFPDEYFNIMFLEQFALMKDYKIKYRITEKGAAQYLEIDFLTSLAQEEMLLNEETAFISNLIFTNIEKNIHTHLESAFKIL